MKTLRNYAIVAALTVSLTMGTGTSTAQEVTPPKEPLIPFASERVLTWDENGNPTSGVITFDVGTKFVRPFTTENVGGGTWTYGTEYTLNGSKVCKSSYIHRTKTHTATATMGTSTQTDRKSPGEWAHASVSGSIFAGTCNAYWSTQ